MSSKTPFKLLAMIFLAVALLPLFSSQASAEASWDSNHNNWDFRKNISVDNTHTSSATLTDYQIPINISYDSNMQTNFSDLRFTWYNISATTQTNASYYIESQVDSSWAYVWIKVPQIASATIETVYMYYGNTTTATSESNGEQTFLLFDDFNDASFNTSKWTRTLTGGSTTESGGTLTVTTASASFEGIRSTNTFSYNTSVRMRGNINEPTSDISMFGFMTSNTTHNDADQSSFVIVSNVKYMIAGDGSGADYYTAFDYENQDFIFMADRGANETRFSTNDTLRNTSNRFTSVDRRIGASVRGASNTVTMDWVFIRNFYTIEPVSTAGTEQENNFGPTVTINAPTNTTYFILNSFPFNFSATDLDGDVENITAELEYPNGTISQIYQNLTYTDGFEVYFTKNFIDLGQYNLTVYAVDDSSNEGSATVFFTIDDIEVESTAYSSILYETNTTNLTITYRVNFDVISSVTSNLNWNNTVNSPQDYSTTNATHIIHIEDIVVPLLQVNNSAVNHNWNFTYTYTNSTNATGSTTNNSQSIWFAYYLEANSITESDINPIEGDTLGIFFNFTTVLSLATLSATWDYNGTNTSLGMTQSSYGLFRNTTFIVPTISDTNESAIVNATGIITFGSNTRTVNSEDDTITIHKVVLTDCTNISNTTTMNFFLKDEETDVDVNGTIEMTHNVSNAGNTRNYNFVFTNVTNATICINPAFATYELESWIQYGATGYSTRDYFLDQEISNVTSNISLYLLTDSNSFSTLFVVRDAQNNPVPDAIIQIQRYFVGNNTYKTVAQCKVDDPQAKCHTFLEILDVYYRYIVTLDGSVLLTTTPAQIVCQPINDRYVNIQDCPPYPQRLQISTSEEVLWFKITGQENIQYSCSVNEATNILSCTVLDSTGLMASSNLIVEQKGALEYTEICNTLDTSSSVTHTCDLGNRTGNIYKYQLLGRFSEPPRIFVQEILDYSTGIVNFGTQGIFLALAVTMTLFFVGIVTPATAIIAGLGGVILSSMLNLVPVSYGSIIGLVIATFILIWKMRQ